MILGTAQDGGLPQIGSDHPLDLAARADPKRRRFVAALLLVDPRVGKRWLIDATPDIREQVEVAREHPPTRRPQGHTSGDRPPEPRSGEGPPQLFDGIFLTHAHMGHYTGLLHLGREAHGARRVPVYGSVQMTNFLATNEPWALLVRLGHVHLETFTGARPISLAGDLTITPIPVPHRAELTDTHGFVIRGPHRAFLYVPDIDKWERWERRIEDLISEVDIALLDGTFFSDDELPGRSMAEIPHPFISESIARFATLAVAERRKIRFTHLNHTNPASDPKSPVAAAVRAAGMAIAEEGEVLPL